MCQKQIRQLKAQISLSEAERKELKAKYFDLLTENLKKDVEIAEMEKKIRPNIFHEFENKFSTDSMKRLRLIGFAQKEDSAFVLAVMRGLYEGRLAVLSNKTVSGHSKNKTKGPITPAKMSIISNMFNERVESANNSVERKMKIKKHIKSAIGNINKTGH